MFLRAARFANMNLPCVSRTPAMVSNCSNIQIKAARNSEERSAGLGKVAFADFIINTPVA
jgi:hypothetical protein